MSIETHTTSSTTSYANAEVMRITSTQTVGERPRFVYIGSLARGVMLGNDVTQLSDPQGRRFQDVDVIDRLNVLTKKHTVAEGKLDAMHTLALHPVESDGDIWGMYDFYEPEDQEPLVTFPEKCLGLSAVHFSALYPDETVEIPEPAALLALSNLYSHTNNLPKHHDQLHGLKSLSADLDPLFEKKLNLYMNAIDARYPLSVYSQIRKRIFNISPKVALSVQDGALGLIGKVVRQARSTGNHTYDRVDF